MVGPPGVRGFSHCFWRTVPTLPPLANFGLSPNRALISGETIELMAACKPLWFLQTKPLHLPFLHHTQRKGSRMTAGKACTCHRDRECRRLTCGKGQDVAPSGAGPAVGAPRAPPINFMVLPHALHVPKPFFKCIFSLANTPERNYLLRSVGPLQFPGCFTPSRA